MSPSSTRTKRTSIAGHQDSDGALVEHCRAEAGRSTQCGPPASTTPVLVAAGLNTVPGGHSRNRWPTTLTVAAGGSALTLAAARVRDASVPATGMLAAAAVSRRL